MWIEDRGQRQYLVLSAVFMGIALATKYTAIQTGGALGIAMLIIGAGSKTMASSVRGAVVVGGVGLLLASPWYVRNFVNTGNPVYPFFYSVFGGSNWSEANAAAYSASQAEFGIGQKSGGGKDISALPGAAVALALHPDKQIDGGTPMGAVGPAFLLGLLWWPLSGLRKAGAFEKLLLATALITLITWFFLTQQSRYIISLVAVAAPLLGGAVVRLPSGFLPASAIALQAFFTGFLFTRSPLAVPDPEQALRAGFDFYPETLRINEIGKSGPVNVALYDEVRGYYLDVPYFWANPGHHTMLEYDSFDEPKDLVSGLKGVDTTHVLLKLSALGQEGTALLNGLVDPNFNDFENCAKFRVQIIQAFRLGLLESVEVFQRPDSSVRSILFKIR
ncbi:MAG: hypothetical protein M3R13_07605, partial [Armatimonadota bacterium]|nr:hypothetical protein [Armatimonadota bacterium]